jgi:hypothetical protein
MTCKLALVMSVGWCLIGCGGNAPQSGGAAGEACEIVHNDLTCRPASTLCYSSGFNSSCAGGDLCIGDGNGLSCAYRCTQTSDCTASSATAICMQDCGMRSLNGFCVEIAQHSELLRMSCSTADDRTTTTGVVN